MQYDLENLANRLVLHSGAFDWHYARTYDTSGHTTVEEVSDKIWAHYASQCRSRTGRKTRMVYVHPDRYALCRPCTLDMWEHNDTPLICG